MSIAHTPTIVPAYQFDSRRQKLLTIGGNPKIGKSDSFETADGSKYWTAILHLAPAKASGYQTCPMAELAGCIAGCLNTSGHGGIAKGGAVRADNGLPDNTVQAARINKTRFLFQDKDGFVAQLKKEIAAHIRRCDRAGVKPAIRLNGTSDIRWENYGVIQAFPDVQFYDYTKISNRRNIPANYHLTFSYSEASPAYILHADKAIDAGMNVAVVFRDATEIPPTFLGLRTVDADRHDLRFLDSAEAGGQVVAALIAKGRAKKDTSGFVIAPYSA